MGCPKSSFGFFESTNFNPPIRDPPQTTSKGGLWRKITERFVVRIVGCQRNNIFRASYTKRDYKFGRVLQTTLKIKREPTGKTLSADKLRRNRFPPPQSEIFRKICDSQRQLFSF